MFGFAHSFVCCDKLAWFSINFKKSEKISLGKLPPNVGRCSFSAGLNMSEAIQTEPFLTVTEAAARQVGVVRSKEPENSDKTLRLFVEEGGCSGLQYGMVFDEKRDDDRALEFFGETVLVDDFSVNYLRGAVVDYSDGLNDSGFKIKNPNAKQSCGCGNSFET